jgi:chromate transporter
MATRVFNLFAIFLKLGCTCFGGPVAHLGYFHEEFVRRRQWLDDEHYSDLVALCNFLPGPASSQMVFAIGMQRAGLAGALAASLGFLLPSAGLMILFAYGVAALGDVQGAAWLHGLRIAAAAVVAQAVWNMARRLCPDFPRAVLALAATGIVLGIPGAYMQMGVLAAGLVMGLLFARVSSFGFRVSSAADPPASGNQQPATGHRYAAAALLIYAILLVALPALATSHGERVLASFYRAGALVFGGGHVVLPLLRAEVVPPGWISDQAFLAGYGAAQAVPGPLFSFAAYLGTVIFAGPHAWLGGLACLMAIYVPAWLVVGGALPYWQSLRGQAWAQGALRGANAAVVGILLAALVNPIATESLNNWADAVAAIVMLGLLQKWHTPPWLVVLLAATLGKFI